MSDKGFGKFGSVDWHENTINNINESSAICWYMLDLGEIVMRPCGTVEDTRAKAIKILRDEM